MKEHGKITERQFAGIIANTMIGVGILTLPSDASREAGSSGWFCVLLVGIIALAALLIIIRLGKRFPQQTVMEYSPLIVGKWLGTAIGLSYSLYWLLASGFTFRIFAEMMTSSILIKTPIEFIIISMLITIIYFVRHDMEVIARVNELYFLLIIIPIIAGSFLSIQEVQVIHLLPLPFIGGADLMAILNGSKNIIGSFVGFEVILLLIPFIVTPGKLYSYGLRGWLSPVLIYVIIVFMGIGVFGVKELQNLMWPLLELVKVTTFPGLLLERLEAIFISLWVIAVFTTVGNFFYSGIIGLTQVIKLSDHRTLIYPLTPLFFLISIYPANIYQAFNLINLIGQLGAVMAFILPGFLYLMAVIRGIKGEKHS